MDRRAFLNWLAVTPALSVAWPQSEALAQLASARPDYRRLLILVELKGGNDALNMLVPYADPLYYSLRPRIAVPRDEVLALNKQMGFHPAMQALMPLWQRGELAAVQGLGYPQPNLSHFRSIEIWDTASASDVYLQEGWLTRAFGRNAPPSQFVADGVLLGSSELGPLQGSGARAIVLSNPDQFLRQAKLVSDDAPVVSRTNSALRHLHKVEHDVSGAANQIEARLGSARTLNTQFPGGAFGNTVKTAARVLASGSQVAVLRLTQTGYDTHQNQPETHANLLRQLAEGLAALRESLLEMDLWRNSLIMTYAEFGRRPADNQSKGTDHGTAAAHLVMGGQVQGGLLGEAPRLDQLDRDGNLRFTTDFRRYYATALQGWWGLDSARILGGKHAPLAIVRA